MDRESLLKLAEREKTNRRYGQMQADLRNIAMESAFGKYQTTVFTQQNVRDQGNNQFWTEFAQKVNAIEFADARDYDCLSVYELTNFLASRALHVNMGVVISADDTRLKNGVEVALGEIAKGAASAVIRRRTSSGELLYFDINSLVNTGPKPGLKHFGTHHVRTDFDELNLSAAKLSK